MVHTKLIPRRIFCIAKLLVLMVTELKKRIALHLHTGVRQNSKIQRILHLEKAGYHLGGLAAQNGRQLLLFLRGGGAGGRVLIVIFQPFPAEVQLGSFAVLHNMRRKHCDRLDTKNDFRSSGQSDSKVAEQ